MCLAAGAVFGQQGNTQDGVNFFDNYIEAKGIGVAAKSVVARSAQGYATARSAAITQAQVELAGMINNIQVDSVKLVELSAAVQDTIRTRLSTTIRGGQIVSESTLNEYMSQPAGAEHVEIIMRLPLSGSGGVARPLLEVARTEIIKRQDELNLVAYKEPAPARGAAPAPAPVPAAADFDALIVRVPSGFKPSMAPKILSEKGEVLFSVKDIAPDILLSRGVAQFTTNESKAKVVLEGMGAKSIMTVPGSLRTDTDAEVSTGDASKIFNANKSSSMLSRGRVVFLVAKSS
jgi:hypothetical protein